MQKFSDGMEVTFEDFNNLQNGLVKELYDRVIYEILQKKDDAFFSGAFVTSFASSTSVSVSGGLGMQKDSSQVDPNPTYRPLFKDGATALNLAAPDGSNDRIDIIVISSNKVSTKLENRKYKDAISSVISTVQFTTREDWEATIEVVTGTPDVSPVAPATPSGKIKIAECLVSAVTGMAGSGAITDTRVAMPVGGDILLNTLGYDRLTAGAAVGVSTLMSDIDALLKAGLQDYTDIIENNSPDPEIGNPDAGNRRIFYRDGVLFIKDSGGVKVPVGSGGGGGGGLVWTSPDGQAPELIEEYGQDVFKFGAGLDQKLVVYLKVPSSYLAGRQISMDIGLYSPSAANTILLSATIGLIRKNNDPVDTPFQSRTSTNTALTNTVAKQLRTTTLDLTTAIGQVNGAAVQAGDMLKIELERGSDTDTADVRFIPTSTEVIVG